jgi:hypothetical protein
MKNVEALAQVESGRRETCYKEFRQTVRETPVELTMYLCVRLPALNARAVRRQYIFMRFQAIVTQAIKDRE